MKFELEMTGSPFSQEKDIIMATNHLPLSLSIVQKNEKQTSFSVSTSGFLVQSVEAVKIKDHPLFQPLTEMEFVTHVTHGGSVKFLPAV